MRTSTRNEIGARPIFKLSGCMHIQTSGLGRGFHSFTSALKLSTFGHIHASIRVTWGTKTAQVKLTVNECKPLGLGLSTQRQSNACSEHPPLPGETPCRRP